MVPPGVWRSYWSGPFWAFAKDRRHFSSDRKLSEANIGPRFSPELPSLDIEPHGVPTGQSYCPGDDSSPGYPNVV